MTHIDDWLDKPVFVDDENRGERWAKWFLNYKRMAAWAQYAFAEFIEGKRLFCTYQDRRYRCTGASRLGDVWITTDLSQEFGYETRVPVDDCTNWSDQP